MIRTMFVLFPCRSSLKIKNLIFSTLIWRHFNFADFFCWRFPLKVLPSLTTKFLNWKNKPSSFFLFSMNKRQVSTFPIYVTKSWKDINIYKIWFYNHFKISLSLYIDKIYFLLKISSLTLDQSFLKIPLRFPSWESLVSLY